MDLSAAKILAVLVVALLVLGPDKLPQAARQVGLFAKDFRRFRDGLHAEVRQAFGDPQELSTLPRRGQAWMDSVTAEAWSATSTRPGETPASQGGPMPGHATSQAPPASGPVAEVAPPDRCTGIARDQPDSSGFEREFN